MFFKCGGVVKGKVLVYDTKDNTAEYVDVNAVKALKTQGVQITTDNGYNFPQILQRSFRDSKLCHIRSSIESYLKYLDKAMDILGKGYAGKEVLGISVPYQKDSVFTFIVMFDKRDAGSISILFISWQNTKQRYSVFYKDIFSDAGQLATHLRTGMSWELALETEIKKLEFEGVLLKVYDSEGVFMQIPMGTLFNTAGVW